MHKKGIRQSDEAPIYVFIDELVDLVESKRSKQIMGYLQDSSLDNERWIAQILYQDLYQDKTKKRSCTKQKREQKRTKSNKIEIAEKRMFPKLSAIFPLS